MLDYGTKVSPPSEDERWKVVDTRMRRHGYEADALIEVLHSVQETFGYISEEALRYVSLSLKLPLSKVYGVASFYHFFTLTPPGEHSCVVCTGTACYLKGAPALLKTVQESARVEPGQVTWDGNLTFQTVRCIGACGAAPVVIFDSNIASKVTKEQVTGQIASFAIPPPPKSGDDL